MPYQMDSGLPLGADEQVKADLVRHALQHAKECNAKFLEIRHYEPAPFLEEIGFQRLESQLVTTTVDLRDITRSKLRRGHRKEVDYALEHDVEISESNTLEGLRMFRKQYLMEGRQLGAPQPNFCFFENLHRLLPDGYRLWLASLKGKCLAAALVLTDGRSVFGRNSAYGSKEAQALKVSKAIVWRAISDCAAGGAVCFNMGISWSHDRGLIYNKEGWNGVTRDVHIYVFPIRSRPPEPGRYLGGFSGAKAVWRRLPLPLVDRVGHWVTRWIC